MQIHVLQSPEALGQAAAARCREVINNAIKDKGRARVVFSTGASQFTTLAALLAADVDFSKVEAFHLDEYIGRPETHPASFRKYLQDRLFSKAQFGRVCLVNAPEGTDAQLGALDDAIAEAPIDLGIIGIGENAHIAFNDPPADFAVKKPYITVTLDEACRAQQVREGWFASLDDVPQRAVTMTVWQILQCKTIVSAVPFAVKAEAVRKTVTSEVSPLVPATALKTHPHADLYLDTQSAALL